MNVHRGSRLCYAAKAGAIALMLGMVSAAQDQPAAANGGDVGASLVELQSEVHELKDLVQQLKQEATASRAEISRLRLALWTAR